MTSLLSLCLKLYMLNVLQYSKFRPLCIIKTQSFPFITQAQTASTAAGGGVVTPLTTASGVATSALTTASAGDGITTPGSVTITTITITPITTVTNAPITTAGTTTANAQTTTAATTVLINTRQRNSQRLIASAGYQYINPSDRYTNCHSQIDYCLEDGSRPNVNCPCFDLRSSKLDGQKPKERSCIGPEKDHGLCKTVENCPLLVEEYYQILHKRPGISYERFLKISKCRETTNEICCPIRRRP